MTVRNVGECVKIREDLRPEHFYDNVYFASGMEHYCGKYDVIQKVFRSPGSDVYKYKLKGNSWTWSGLMFCDFSYDEDEDVASIDPHELLSVLGISDCKTEGFDICT